MSNNDDDGCCGCFVFLVFLPLMILILYQVWDWSFTKMDTCLWYSIHLGACGG